MMFKILPTLLCSCLVVASVFANEVNIPADRDTTLIEDAEGDVANGSGPNIFVGHISQAVFGIRRGLIRFDVAAALPEDAIIDRVSLRLYQNSSNQKSGTVSIYRMRSDWGEGKSFKSGGSGAPAEADDATWLHAFYDERHWTRAGGDYVSDASATEMVNDTGFYSWKSTGKLVDDVRLWLHAPQQNFGWLLQGDEATRGSVKRFASREGKESNQHPMLSIEYHLPGE
jgi:hypothetical protein